MSLDDWILALHVLSAFAMVAGAVLYSVLLVTIRRTDTPGGVTCLRPVVRVGDVATAIGAGGTIAFGLWLAFSVGGYDPWDGWIIAAVVLWVMYVGIGQRTGGAFLAAMRKAEELEAAGQTAPSAEVLELNRARPLLVGHALASLLVLLILIDMIWKPGA
jgi:hypothetical protein